MIITIVRGGGIGGIVVRTSLSTDALPAGDERRIEQLAANLAPPQAPPPAVPDETVYRVTVGDTAATYTESTLPEDVRELIDFVCGCPEREDTVG